MGGDADVLKAIVAGHDDVVTGQPPDSLIEAARWHGVLSLLRHSPVRQLLSAPAQADLNRRYVLEQGRRLQVLEDLPFVAAALTGLSWAVVKGPVLSETVYAQRGRRGFSDLDVLVLPAHFGSAIEALEQRGATLIDRNWQLALRQQRGELSLRLPGGSPLDLHWHLVNDVRTRARLPLGHDMLGRTQLRTLGDQTVPVLHPADALVHVLVHSTLSGGQRLVWVRDAVESLARGDVGLSEVLQQADANRCRLPVVAALQRASRLVNRIPDAGLASIWTTGLKTLNRTRREPGARRSGSTLVAATRDTTWASTRAAARSVMGGYSREQRVTAADLALLVDDGARQKFLRSIELGKN